MKLRTEIAMTLFTSSTTRRLQLLPLLLVPPMTTGIVIAAITITITNTITADYYNYCFSFPYYYYHYMARLLLLARNLYNHTVSHRVVTILF